jgi:hypothetical protein
MKKTLAVVLFFLITANILLPQEAKDTLKKVYRSENNRLYVNKDLGVYLWLSTSPDEQSEKVRLMSDSSHRYTNPMYFDTEGYNTVRSPWAVDTNTRKVVYPLRDIIFEVYADGIPPVTKSEYKSSLMQVISGKKYFGNDLRVTMKSYDGVSGVENTFYSLNNKQENPYIGELKDFKEGENTLKYYAIDRVGNIEKPKEDIFFIDMNPPKTVYSIMGDQNEKYVSANAKIKLESKDSLSGIKAIYYRVNTGSFKRYYQPIPVTVLTSDNATISFYAEDQVGNKEKLQVIGGKDNSIQIENEQGTSVPVVFEFYIDRDPPVVQVDILGDSYSGKYQYISPRSRISITAEDEKAGVDKILFSINSATVDQEYAEPFTPEAEGLHYIRAKANDYVGNTSALITKSFFADFQSPVSTLTVGDPKFSSRDTLFITSGSVIKINARDDHSGIASIVFSTDGDSAIQYTSSFVLSKAGAHKIVYGSIDLVKNQEKKQELEVYVDDQPPVIHHNFSVESIGNKTVREEIYTIYPTNVMLYLSATDARSGSDRIEYSINGGSVQSTNPVKGFTTGNYQVEVKAYDVLGNFSTTEIKFAIEK